MLYDTACPDDGNDGTPNPKIGPWCQGTQEQCIVCENDPNFTKNGKKTCEIFLGALSAVQFNNQCKKNAMKKACPSFCRPVCIKPDCAADAISTKKFKIGRGKFNCAKIGRKNKCDSTIKPYKKNILASAKCPTTCQLDGCTIP